MKEHGVPFNLDGLLNLQETLAESAGRPDDNDYTYWSAVVKLGAFAGELIRATNGGTWDSVGSGTLPLALVTNFKGEQGTVNPLGKAMKRFQNGAEDSLVPLVKATQSNSTKSNEDYRVELTPLEVDTLVWTPERRN